ncbi:GD23464 [Drosophila simulans]|uniref:GD23464 n=1 Tax=Drosophila simulans TaxID=7240 RepID=B4NUZ8_DROSI|nr:GD23464 [Drosophila simulans]
MNVNRSGGWASVLSISSDEEVGRGYIESSASVATLAFISSIAFTSAAAIAALKARPYLVAPFVTTASAPPTPQPHASISTNTARTSPATPTRRRIAPENDLDLVEDLGVALAQIEDPQTLTKNKSHRFFWRKATCLPAS